MKKTVTLFLCALLCIAFALPSMAEDNTLKCYFAIDEQDAGWQAFSARHPGVRLQHSNDVYYQNTAEISRALLTGEMRCDVLGITTLSIDPVPMMTKGYLADLSANPQIQATLQRMYPAVRDAVTVQGKIYALPCSAQINYLRIDRAVWEEAGLDTAHIPDTAEALLIFLEDWCDRMETDPVEGVSVVANLDPTLYTAATYTKILTEWLIESFYMQTQYAGQPVEFSPDTLIPLLSRCQGIGRRLYQIEKHPLDATGFGKTLLVQEQRPYWVADYRDVVFLRFSKDQPKLFLTYLNLCVLPEGAEHQDMALELLGDLAARLDESKTLLFFSDAGLVMQPHYKANRANVEYWIGETERQLQSDQLTEDTRINLEDKLLRLRASLARMDTDEGKYVMTQEKLDEYRQYVAPYLFIQRPDGFFALCTEDHTALENLEKEFSENVIDARQLITELNRVGWMIRLERGE